LPSDVHEKAFIAFRLLSLAVRSRLTHQHHRHRPGMADCSVRLYDYSHAGMSRTPGTGVWRLDSSNDNDLVGAPTGNTILSNRTHHNGLLRTHSIFHRAHIIFAVSSDPVGITHTLRAQMRASTLSCVSVRVTAMTAHTTRAARYNSSVRTSSDCDQISVADPGMGGMFGNCPDSSLSM